MVTASLEKSLVSNSGALDAGAGGAATACAVTQARRRSAPAEGRRDAAAREGACRELRGKSAVVPASCTASTKRGAC